MNAPIAELIEAHRAAVIADEASFDGAGNDLGNGPETFKVEARAFRALVLAPCRDADEAAAKVHYIVSGTVGERTTLMECLFDYSELDDEADLYKLFLESLVAWMN
ncbi:MAG: hypothetical protein EOR51_11970 [Mesorhizobium sp.]|uniref:hypothetical protein n=1 Tax=Mesorhizobium sp. TaxID=1871066 RepID=UPI000FEAAC37|nr:hypothetical protein [Mesorhizobium sp.]RWK79622.1 MAG: hypothetical protein EOR50_05700 [Mesorhizobium sp.]RWK82397.1 MAG: hypothetical protein EOR51_11970 [Mesorhizobium sp.]RWL08784.1 MAG: hypothetical protein EOR55_03580 [Mesorhizobium sp.]